MKFRYDHDLHIHSEISYCSSDPEQNNERILRYAEENDLHTICLTNHFWDASVPGCSDWYRGQDLERLSLAKPLPGKEGIRFLFGCEAEMNRYRVLGLSEACLGEFDFIAIPLTHFHMRGFTLFPQECENAETRARAWIERFRTLLDMDLPFRKIGLAHPVCHHIAKEKAEYLRTLELLPERELRDIFRTAASLGCGIELNGSDLGYDACDEEIILRPYRIAKEEGCKFYCGSDAHHPANFIPLRERYERVIDALDLTEADKYFVPDTNPATV